MYTLSSHSPPTLLPSLLHSSAHALLPVLCAALLFVAEVLQHISRGILDIMTYELQATIVPVDLWSWHSGNDVFVIDFFMMTY